MCIILDTNFMRDYLRPTDDMTPLRKWVEEKGGKIAYSPIPSLMRELEHNPKMEAQLREYGRADRVKLIPSNDVLAEKKKVEKDGNLRSNDSHIIALAKVGKIKVLVSQDKQLGEDFKRICGGSIYKEKKHRNLLRDSLCS